jgi:uncharacterized protein YndB with AHSA1/START domain
MAAPIVVSTPTNATADQVFAAITESSGLAAFWIQDSHAEPVIGSVTRMNLPSGSLLQLRVDDLEVGHRVVWTPISEFSRPPSWLGTTVAWDLAAKGDITDISLQHGGWAPDLPQVALGQLTFLWAQVLGSLRTFVESGVPKPIIPSRPASPPHVP